MAVKARTDRISYKVTDNHYRLLPEFVEWMEAHGFEPFAHRMSYLNLSLVDIPNDSEHLLEFKLRFG